MQILRSTLSLLILLTGLFSPTKSFGAVCPACVFAVAAVIKGDTSPDTFTNIWNIAMPIFTLISILAISAAEYMKKKKIEVSHIDLSFFSLLFSLISLIIMVFIFPKIFPFPDNTRTVTEYICSWIYGSYICHIVYTVHCILKAHRLTFMFSRVIMLFVVLIISQYIIYFTAHIAMAVVSVVIMGSIYSIRYRNTSSSI